MSRKLVFALGALVLFVLSSCGGDEAPKSNQAIATEALLTAQDLPAGSRERPSAVSGAPCGPKPILEKDGAAAKESPMFVVGATSTQQVVGVFAATDKARSNFKILTSQLRRRCIQETLENFSALQGLAGASAKSLPLLALQVGDSSRIMPFTVTQPGKSTGAYLTAVLVRVDRAIAEMVFLARRSRPPAPLMREVANAAATELEAALR